MESHTSRIRDTIQAYFDVDKIDKVVFNLLSNAYKYTGEGGEIKVALSVFLQNGHTYLSIIVSDTGKGIASEDIDKIFTRFYTNQHWVSSETNGIGLSLTKELLELHHGTISVESEVGRGSSFTVIIPIDKESYTEAEFQGEGTGSAAHVYNECGEEVLTYTEGVGWQEKETKAESQVHSALKSTYYEAFCDARKALNSEQRTGGMNENIMSQGNFDMKA